jgi:hypothetical protein
MTSQYRHRRSSNPATAFATLEPGEIAVNTANRQIAVGDAASATLGTPEPLLGVRFFDARAIYAIGDYVINAGLQYCAKAANGPGAFTPANWNAVTMEGAVSGTFVAKAGDTVTGGLTVNGTLTGVGIVTAGQWLGVGWNTTNTGAIYFGNLATKNLNFDGNNFHLVGGPFLVDAAAIYSGFGGATGSYYFGNSGTCYLAYDGSKFNFVGAPLTISPAAGAAALFLNKPASGVGNQLYGQTGGLSRWLMLMGNSAAESGGNVGSDFALQRYADGGGSLDTPLTIARATGIVDFLNKPTVAGATFAAPFDAMAYSGMQINGGMEVNQQNPGTGIGVSGYPVDLWYFQKAGAVTANFSVQQFSWNNNGFPSLLAISVTTAQAAMAASDIITLYHFIEGYRVARLGWGAAGAMPITIGFWTAHTRTGTYSVSVRNGAASRSYTATYTQNVSTAMEYKTITVPGDTVGTWAKDNTSGLSLAFPMAAGSTFVAPAANTWYGANYIAAPGQVNAVAATTDVFRITGVVVLPGIEAPSAARSPLVMRPYDQELLTCMRYCYKRVFNPNQVLATLQVYNTTSASGAIMDFPVQMRAIPTIITSGSFGLANANGAVTNLSGGGLVATQDGLSINGAAVASAVLIAGNATLFMQTAAGGGYYLMDARFV